MANICLPLSPYLPRLQFVFLQNPDGPAIQASNPGSTFVDYRNQALPVYCATFVGNGTSNNCTYQMPYYAAMALWDDLYMYDGTPQGLYYQVDGPVGSRTVTFEWYTSFFQQPSRYYHLSAQFSEATPGTVLYRYYQVADSGLGATVGIQGKTSKSPVLIMS